jgi:3',5'-cyclic AMP phosphodiesterase CpdA
MGGRLFTMVIYTDTHVNQAETKSMSPHLVNRLANARMRYVMNEINGVNPDFVIHLGDLVHPVPVMAIYADAADRFHELTASLNCPQYLVPGNHDVGDKPIKWGPAGVVCDDHLALWQKFFGRHFYAFDHKSCHFVVVNAQIINSGLPSEAEQSAWLEADLEASRDKRVFLNIHYPPFLNDPEEDEHYDNIAEPGRSWLLALLATHRVEALFAGHVHNFWYNRYADTECYLLPSTAFVRHDYSEMYRVEPGAEYGRNDAAKLGYFVVDVHEHGHICHPVRTFGRTLPLNEPAPGVPERVGRIHPIINRRAAVGLDLRQSWADVVEIPPSGGLDEFARKAVRNDYPLMAFWEMGVRRLRVPLHDLANPRIRERMRHLQRLGQRFTVFSFEVPDGEARQALVAHADLVDGWEIGFAWDDLAAICDAARRVKENASVDVFLSKLRSKEDLESDGQRYYHVINHGFVASEGERLRAILDGPGHDLIDGFVFRVAHDRSPWQDIHAIAAAASAAGTSASVHVRLSTASPADTSLDDLQHANRVAETIVAAETAPGVRAFFDTFADVDRGYFVRSGLVDRRFNPRLGARVAGHLMAALNVSDEVLHPESMVRRESARVIEFACDTSGFVLILPDSEITPAQSLDLVAAPDGEAIALIDLESGEVARSPDGRRGSVAFSGRELQKGISGPILAMRTVPSS